MYFKGVLVILTVVIAITLADKILRNNDCEKDDGPGRCTVSCLLLPTYQYGLCESDKKCHCKSTLLEPKREDLGLDGSKCDDKNKDANKNCSLQCIYASYSRGYCKGQLCFCQGKLD